MEQKKEEIYLSPEDSYNLYKLFYEVTQLLEKNGIIYWITAGTFLGAVRCGGIIKWDDDIDIMIPIEYKDKLYKLLKNNDKLHIYDGNKIKTHDKISYRNNNNKLFIDIFYGKKNIINRKYIFEHNNNGCKKKWPNEYFYLENLFPLKKYKFGVYEVYGPKKYKDFMERNFSKKWNTEAVISHSHSKKLKKIIVFTMKPEDYEPAKPFFIPTLYEPMYGGKNILFTPELNDYTTLKENYNKKVNIFYNIFVFLLVFVVFIIIVSLVYLFKK